MPIYFQLTNIPLPITLESIGNHWEQESIRRNQGYPAYHWLQTEEGQGEFRVQDKRLVLEKGEGVLIAPFVPHTYHPMEGWLTSFATFEGELREHLASIIGTAPYILAKDTANFSFTEWTSKIITQHEKKQLDPADLSVQCYRFLLQISQMQTVQSPQHHHLKDKYILPVIKEIETSYADALTVEKLASKTFVSQQYLTRLFKRFMGKSPYQYLIDFRINKAKELLVNHPEIEVQEIGLRVGFQSPSQFIAVFKSKTKVTPKKFSALHHKRNS